MLRGEKVTLRAVTREDLPGLVPSREAVGVLLEVAGSPPRPTALERLQKTFDQEAAEPPRDKTEFAIEAEGHLIGHCGLFNIDETARHCELGITIGGKDFWGRGYGRDVVRLLLRYAFRLRNLRRV